MDLQHRKLLFGPVQLDRMRQAQLEYPHIYGQTSKGGSEHSSRLQAEVQHQLEEYNARHQAEMQKMVVEVQQLKMEKEQWEMRARSLLDAEVQRSHQERYANESHGNLGVQHGISNLWVILSFNYFGVIHAYSRGTFNNLQVILFFSPEVIFDSTAKATAVVSPRQFRVIQAYSRGTFSNLSVILVLSFRVIQAYSRGTFSNLSVILVLSWVIQAYSRGTFSNVSAILLGLKIQEHSLLVVIKSRKCMVVIARIAGSIRLEMIAAPMADLSDGKEEAAKSYSLWTSASPVEKLKIQPPHVVELETGRWSRVNSRAASMILLALHENVRQEMVSRRSKGSATALIFRLLTIYQPGGQQEKESFKAFNSQVKNEILMRQWWL